MLIEYLGFVLYGNLVLMGLVYLYLLKIRHLIGFQLGMNLANLAGGFLAIVSGVIMIYQFPLKYVAVTIIATLLGMVVGGLVGGLFDYQTLLTGYINGLMMGLMAPMVGAAAKGSMTFLVFIEVVFLISLGLLLLSAKKT
jgi:hypothetical protein